jgi:hypothetical protein
MRFIGSVLSDKDLFNMDIKIRARIDIVLLFINYLIVKVSKL